jgi:hypothetical protein
MRERLIELIRHSSRYIEEDNSLIETIADHLLANGVIVLPCKVGNVVYTNINGTSLHNSFRVESVDLLGFSNGLYSWTWHQLGKSVFLTLEEAEAKLKGGAE